MKKISGQRCSMWKIEEITAYKVYDDVSGEYIDEIFEEEYEAENCIEELKESESVAEMVRNERW